MDFARRAPRLAASTADRYSRSIAESKLVEKEDDGKSSTEHTFHAGAPNHQSTNVLDLESETNYFKSAQW